MQTAASTSPLAPTEGPVPARLGAVAGLLGLAVVVAYGSAPLALLGGAAFALLLPGSFPRPLQALSSRLLQTCVVLLGFSMDLPAVLRLGARGSVFAAISIAATLGAGVLLSRRLRVERVTGLLISVGTAICGGSAIAAASTVVAATETQTAVAIGSVFLLNALALYTFPVVGHALHLSQGQFGLWSGIAIHDVSSVVGAGLTFGSLALQTAVAVKLARSLWIVPVTLSLSAMGTGGRGARPKLASFPWFILLFVGASLARSYLPQGAGCSWIAAAISRRGMVAVLFLIGTSLSLPALKSVGWRPLALGVALWLAVSAVSLGAILHFRLTA